MDANDRTKFLAKLVALSVAVIELSKDLQEVNWQYWKMNYGKGAATALTDDQASGVAATADDVTAAITAIEALLAVLIEQSQIGAFFKLAR